MEDQVYNGIDDYLRYVRRWVKLWETPLTANSIKEYGSAVWNQWLARRYGAAIIRKAWARAIHVQPGRLLGRRLRTGDPRAPGAPTSATTSPASPPRVAEWRTGEGFRESGLFPDMPRQGRLPLDGRPLTRLLNHTTFQLLRVRPRGGRAVVVQRDGAARDRRRPGPGRPDRQRAPGPHRHPPRLQPRRRQADASACATPAASAGSPRSSSTPTPAPRLQRPPARLALPDRPVPFEISGRLVR